MSKELAVSYHDVLLRNGFIEEKRTNPTSNLFPFAVYIRQPKSGEELDVIEVEAFMSFFKIRYKEKSLRLDDLILNKSFHTSNAERNDDVNRNSIVNLYKAFKELNIKLSLV